MTLAFGACSTGPQITRIQDVSESADTPYRKILVIALFSSFDSRRYLEDEVVQHLSRLGTDAVASTSMMNTKTPVTRSVFVDMVEKVGANAVLVTHLESADATATVKDMRPETTVNYSPTYYYNVFEVDVTEYVEPQGVEMRYSLVLLTELYSARDRVPVWGIQSKSDIVLGYDQLRDYSIYVNEAKAITKQLAGDGLIER